MNDNINIGGVSGSGIVVGNTGQVNQAIGGNPPGAAPERSAATSPARGRAGGQDGLRRLGDDEVVELAKLYSTGVRAARLLRRAGFRGESLPVFDACANPYEFWYEVSEQIGHGIALRGRHRLLTVAHTDYPANPVFPNPDDEDPD
jgi:hypothetical protein